MELEFNGEWFSACVTGEVPAGLKCYFPGGDSTVVPLADCPLRLRQRQAAPTQPPALFLVSSSAPTHPPAVGVAPVAGMAQHQPQPPSQQQQQQQQQQQTQQLPLPPSPVVPPEGGRSTVVP